MSYIGKNIKKIRTVKKLSQASFAEIFNLARPSVGAYEEGRAEPKIETIVQIAQHFGLSIDLLLTKELTVNDLVKFNLAVEGFENEDFEETQHQEDDGGSIGLVLYHNFLEYIVNHNSKDYIAKLKKIHLPYDVRDQSRAFQLYGSEMEYNHNGLHHGDILLSAKVDGDLKKQLKIGKVYVIVTQGEVLVKRLHDVEKTLEFSSDDPNYYNVTVELKDVIEIWKVYGVFSTYLNPPSTLENRILQMESEIRELKRKIG